MCQAFDSERYLLEQMEMKQYKRVPHWRVLSDFLKGVSVATLARRYRRPRAWVESVLREAL